MKIQMTTWIALVLCQTTVYCWKIVFKSWFWRTTKIEENKKLIIFKAMLTKVWCIATKNKHDSYLGLYIVTQARTRTHYPSEEEAALFCPLFPALSLSFYTFLWSLSVLPPQCPSISITLSAGRMAYSLAFTMLENCSQDKRKYKINPEHLL